jgi:hypothetical protein
MSLTREQILSAQDANLQEVQVPEWGGSVFIRVMSGKERDNWEAETMQAAEAKKFENMRAKLLSRVLCDEKGDRLFQTSEDVTALGDKSATALQSLFTQATKLNGIGQADQDELLKN